jgi:biotin carboxyl carrier protein
MTQETYQINVNDNHSFSFPADAAQTLDAIPNGDQLFHVLHLGKAYQVEVLEKNLATQTYLLRVNGARYLVKIADTLDQLVQQLGLSAHGSLKINSVKAPMPGLVLQVIVSPGQAVQKGDPLLILEAMKMENVLKAGGEGVVKSINVEKGQAVDKGHLLMEME